jgi:hypothetical protein
MKPQPKPPSRTGGLSKMLKTTINAVITRKRHNSVGIEARF